MRYIGVFGAAIGYGLWVWALKHITPARVAVCLALNPLSATVLGAVLLGEPISPRFIGGLLLVAAGIVVTGRGARPRLGVIPCLRRT